ncbi:MAG: hypothetical protein ACYDBP_14705 [Leptospirales bacterium]
MAREKIHESASERARASRKRREANKIIPEALKLMQFSLTLKDKFIVQDLKRVWNCTGSEVVSRLLEEAGSRNAKEIQKAKEESQKGIES